MCTLSFIPRDRGYSVAMNRDEQRTRPTAFPPAIEHFREGSVLGPQEPGGGRWVLLNNRGITYSLLNWHAVQDHSAKPAESRGQLLNLLATANTPAELEFLLNALILAPFRPFRLVSFFPAQRQVLESQWDTRRLRFRRWPWRTRIWASSGWDERQAARSRAHLFAQSSEAARAGRGWQQQFHSSHLPAKGPFSVCMHRRDAKTVSYAQIEVGASAASLTYQNGSPCRRRPSVKRNLRLHSPLRS